MAKSQARDFLILLHFAEKNKGQNWFQRQYSRKMSHDYSSDGGIEQAAAVAASAYVIDSMEESGKQDKKHAREEPPGISLIPIKSRKEDAGSKRFSFYLSGKICNNMLYSS